MQAQRLSDILKGSLFSLAGLLLLLHVLGFVEKFATILLTIFILLLSAWLILQGLHLAGLLDLLRNYWANNK